MLGVEEMWNAGIGGLFNERKPAGRGEGAHTQVVEKNLKICELIL